MTSFACQSPMHHPTELVFSLWMEDYNRMTNLADNLQNVTLII